MAWLTDAEEGLMVWAKSVAGCAIDAKVQSWVRLTCFTWIRGICGG